MDLNLSNLPSVEPTTQEHVSVLILGSGPAGLSAALYAARAELAPVVLAGNQFGGQVALTFTVENYPGFPEGVGGNELVELFQKQAEKFGARLVYDTATKVDLSARPFRVQTYNTIYLADTLIVATGASSILLDVKGEKELTGRGVSYCATCDGWFFKDKDVMVVGGGDSALEESLFLTRFARSVTIIHRRDAFRAGAILQKRALAHPKIKVMWDTIVTEIQGEDAVRSLKLKNIKTGEVNDVKSDGIFIFIGHRPNTELFRGQLDMDEPGYLKTDITLHTNVPGVFVAGEAGDPYHRQVVTSAGMGAAAAMQATRFVEEHSNEAEAEPA